MDAGGYTVDVTVNKIVDHSNNLTQISPPSGGAWGSTLINLDIEQIFIYYFGKEYINEIICL